MRNSLSGKQHMLVTVASTTTSPVKPWNKRQGKLCGAALWPNTMCGMSRCSAMATQSGLQAQAIRGRCGNT